MLLPILYTISFLDAFAFVLVITSMNSYVTALGGTQFYLGILGSVSALINLIWNPIVGGFSDSLGRKRVILYCMLVVLIGNLITVLTSSLTMFFISRVLTNFGTQIMVLVRSLADDHIKDSDLKMATIGRMQAVGGSCFIFGSLVTGYLSEYENGFKIIYCLIVGMFGINMVLASLIPDSHPKKPKNPQPVSLFTEIKKVTTNLTNIDWSNFWDLFLIKLTVDFVMFVFNFNMIQILTERFEIKGKIFGYVFASVGIMGIMTSLSLPKVKKYFYSNDSSGLNRLFHGCLLLLYTCIGQGLSTTFVFYYINLIPLSIVRVIFETTFTEIILARASQEEKGKVMGTFETTLSLGGLTAPLIAGLVSDLWGSNVSILCCVLPVLAGTLVAYTQRGKRTKSNIE